MSVEITPECIKKTQETLGKFIKKPVLSDRLLTKPPFRFLHDICTAAMRETGFFEGVLNATDCKVENIKDKDGKIAFLQKVIAAVEAANGIKLSIKPNKVVAGYEPVHTNEFLQALGNALEKQQEYQSTTKTQLTPRSKSKPVKKPEKDEAKNKKKPSSTKQGKPEKSENKINDGKSSKSKGSSEKVPQPSEKASGKKSEVGSSPRNAESIVMSNEDQNGEEKVVKHKDRSKTKKAQIASNASQRVNDDDDEQVKPSEKIISSNEKDAKVDSEQAELKRPQSAKPGRRSSLSSSTGLPASGGSPPDHKDRDSPDVMKSETAVNGILTDHGMKRPESGLVKINKITPGSAVNYPTKDPSGKEDSTPIVRPRTGIAPATARPTSARPAAPRIRDRGDIQIHEDIVKAKTGSVEIITDKKENNDPEEDENIVVVEPENELLTEEWKDGTDNLGTTNDQSQNESEHGLLVEQILETQKELDQSRLQIAENKLSGTPEIEWKSNRNRETADREIKKLRLYIQTLTRSVNPLGKLFDYLQEDVDIMQKELTNWKEMNSNLDIEIAQERRLTEQSIEPLKVHLKEVQQLIDQQLEQIALVKGNILRNDQKLQKLIVEMK